MRVTSSIESPGKGSVAVIAGATATGKSAVAVALAEATGGTIINADASQVYADLRILSARPSEADMAAVPHRLYGTLDAATPGSAAIWAAQARREIDAAHDAGRLPILVGGTGLYLRALLDGLAPIPAIDPAVRAAVRGLSAAAARAALIAEDPAAAARLASADDQRTRRALEVRRSTGRTLAEWHDRRGGGLAATHLVVAVVLGLDRDLLRERCAARVDAMLAAGALDEVARLTSRGLSAELPAMRAIGVAPLADHLAGRCSLAEARERIVHDTSRYAKRQATWWRNQTPDWPQLGAAGDLLDRIVRYIG